MGVAALVLGIISLPGVFTFFVGFVLGILAVIFGAVGRSRARRGEATNGGVALAGLICGAVGLAASVALVALLAVGGAHFYSTHKTQVDNYTSCLKQATTPHARQVCARRFRHSIGNG